MLKKKKKTNTALIIRGRMLILVDWTHLIHSLLKWLIHQCPISQSNNHTVDIAACGRSKKWVGLVGVAYWVRLQSQHYSGQ